MFGARPAVRADPLHGRLHHPGHRRDPSAAGQRHPQPRRARLPRPARGELEEYGSRSIAVTAEYAQVNLGERAVRRRQRLRRTGARAADAEGPRRGDDHHPAVPDHGPDPPPARAQPRRCARRAHRAVRPGHRRGVLVGPDRRGPPDRDDGRGQPHADPDLRAASGRRPVGRPPRPATRGPTSSRSWPQRSTGRSSRSPHSDQPPSYTATSSWPSRLRTNASLAEAIPEAS